MPTILITDDDEMMRGLFGDVVAMTKQYGADETFQKPVSGKILTETINLLLSN